MLTPRLPQVLSGLKEVSSCETSCPLSEVLARYQDRGVTGVSRCSLCFVFLGGLLADTGVDKLKGLP